ncbi:MAG: penicillin acylase family protein, partial [Pseudomonadota bacterium]|nr:penicillin acylase family protein [Pseudomonadota bacterium]
MKSTSKRALKVLLVLILVSGVTACSVVGWLFWRAMPDYAGQASMPGLSDPVHIVRDEYGVPHIFAHSMYDAARALGYVHASERLFQMEMQRRAGQGRLSEILGPDGLSIDKFIRTLGLYKLAQSSFEALTPDAQKFFQAYADGVNAWLKANRKALPPEFLVLGLKPEPWQPADSIVWGKLMAVELSKNYKSEILRAQLKRTLDAGQMNALFPPLAVGTPITTEPAIPQPAAGNEIENLRSFDETEASAPDGLGAFTGLDHPASNEWVISGKRTASGKPILANDPHLGLEAPVLWYLARIVTPELSLEGATVPGLPVVLLGQNEHIAWGFTTTGSDVQDLFVETVDRQDSDRYMTPEGSSPFDMHTETIHVKGADDVLLTVRATRHGPVMSDINDEMAKLANTGNCTFPIVTPATTDGPVNPVPCKRVMALAFTALGADDTTSEALMRLNRAQNEGEFLTALQLYQAPPQNIVYADTDGHIGFISPGLVPIRKSGDGTVPVDGATGSYDWAGTIPFAQVPQLFDPDVGFIFNANNAIVGPGFPYFMGVDWEEPYRAQRMQQFFDTIGTHTIDTSAMMQADHLSLAARQLLPYLLAQHPVDPRAIAAIYMLHGWDGTMDKDRPEPVIFEAWLSEMHKLLLARKAGNALRENGPYSATSIAYILGHDFPGKETEAWCGKDCNTVILEALDSALTLLAKRHGIDMNHWRWGDEHVTLLRHKFYSHVPVLSLFSRLDVKSSGDFYTLDRGGGSASDPDHPFARTHGGGFRGLYDLNDPSQLRFMITTGESGHIFSR